MERGGICKWQLPREDRASKPKEGTLASVSQILEVPQILRLPIRSYTYPLIATPLLRSLMQP